MSHDDDAVLVITKWVMMMMLC